MERVSRWSSLVAVAAAFGGLGTVGGNEVVQTPRRSIGWSEAGIRRMNRRIFIGSHNQRRRRKRARIRRSHAKLQRGRCR